MLMLRQSTARDIRMGPFVDKDDGVTPETGITLGAADQAEVLKHDGAATAAMSGTFAAVTGAGGWYDYTASTTDTNTVGEVVFVVQDASVCLPVYVRAYVVEEAVYDDLYAASAPGIPTAAEIVDNFETQSQADPTGFHVNVLEVNGTAQTANDNGADINAILTDTSTTLDNLVDDLESRLGTPSDLGGGATIALMLADMAGATFATGTDSLEAIRNHVGDGTNLTEAGGNGDHLTEAGGDGDHLTESGGTGDQLTAITGAIGSPSDFGSGTSTLAANLQDIADNGTATFDRSTDSLQAIRDRGDSAWTTGGGGSSLEIASGTIGATGNDTTHLHLTGLGYADDDLNGLLVRLYDDSGSLYYHTWITDWANTGDLATVETLPVTPEASVDTYVVFAIRRDINLAQIAGAAVSTSTAQLGVNVVQIEGSDATNQIRDAVVDDATRIDASALNTASAAVGSDGTGLTEAGGNGDHLTEAGGDGDHLTAINLPNQTMDIVGDITGNLSGSVGSVTGNVGGSVASVTGAINTGAGTITTLDGLDTAQDTQHGTTRSKLLAYVQLLARADAAIATDNSTELTAINANGGSGAGSFDNTTDAEEALAGASAPSASDVADAVWDEAQSGHTSSGSFGELATEIASILADTNELQTDDIPGAIAALNDPTAATVAAAVWDALQASHVASGSFGEIATEIAAILVDTDSTLDGKLDAIKAKTDSLTFTVSGEVDSNVQSVNDAALQGDGSAGDKWRPA